MIERLILFFLPNKYTNCKQNASVALAVGKKAKNEHSIYAGYTGNASSIQPLGAGVKEGRWREMDSTLKSCKLIKVIQVVTKEGTGTKENPIRESIAYFTTDGVYIGTLVNGGRK